MELTDHAKKMCQHSCNISLDNLEMHENANPCLIMAVLDLKMASFLGHSEANVGLRSSRISHGLALGANRPGKVSQHSCNVSLDSLKMDPNAPNSGSSGPERKEFLSRLKLEPIEASKRPGKSKIGWGRMFGANDPAGVCQCRRRISPKSLNTLIPI